MSRLQPLPSEGRGLFNLFNCLTILSSAISPTLGRAMVPHIVTRYSVRREPRPFVLGGLSSIRDRGECSLLFGNIKGSGAVRWTLFFWRATRGKGGGGLLRGEPRRWGSIREKDAWRSNLKLNVGRDRPLARDELAAEVVFQRNLGKCIFNELRRRTDAAAFFRPSHKLAWHSSPQRIIVAGEKARGLGRRHHVAPSRLH